MIGQKKGKSQKPTFAEILLFAAFAAVVIFGLYYVINGFFGPGATSLGGATHGKSVAPPRQAPTADHYQQETREVMAPFLEQAGKMTAENFAADNSAMTQLVGKTQERLLTVIVPKEYKSAHLSFILLLEKWKRALTGNADDQKAVLKETTDAVIANPWLATSVPNSGS
jgi:hypothetical protein